MNTSHEAAPSADGRRMLESLRQAVGKALERKRRLGQYAVVWRHGKPWVINADASRVAEEAAPWRTER
ncbi:hypothetical protein [Metallibacterium sp.]